MWKVRCRQELRQWERRPGFRTSSLNRKIGRKAAWIGHLGQIWQGRIRDRECKTARLAVGGGGGRSDRGAVVLGGAARGAFSRGAGFAAREADLMLVLGGDSGDRSLTAARLYAVGMAPRLLLTGLETGPREGRRAYLHWRAQILADAGVPPERLEYDAESGNSWRKRSTTRRLMEGRGWRRVLVVSDPYHMRRLSWTWGKAFEGSGLQFTL